MTHFAKSKSGHHHAEAKKHLQYRNFHAVKMREAKDDTEFMKHADMFDAHKKMHEAHKNLAEQYDQHGEEEGFAI